jgi:hypothetical protein
VSTPESRAALHTAVLKVESTGAKALPGALRGVTHFIATGELSEVVVRRAFVDATRMAGLTEVDAVQSVGQAFSEERIG